MTRGAEEFAALEAGIRRILQSENPDASPLEIEDGLLEVLSRLADDESGVGAGLAESAPARRHHASGPPAMGGVAEARDRRVAEAVPPGEGTTDANGAHGRAPDDGRAPDGGAGPSDADRLLKGGPELGGGPAPAMAGTDPRLGSPSKEAEALARPAVVRGAGLPTPITRSCPGRPSPNLTGSLGCSFRGCPARPSRS